jgi:hypothetical protein
MNFKCYFAILGLFWTSKYPHWFGFSMATLLMSKQHSFLTISHSGFHGLQVRSWNISVSIVSDCTMGDQNSVQMIFHLASVSTPAHPASYPEWTNSYILIPDSAFILNWRIVSWWRNENTVRFQVLTTTTIKVTVLWDVAPWSLVETDRRFRGLYLYITALWNILEDSHLPNTNTLAAETCTPVAGNSWNMTMKAASYSDTWASEARGTYVCVCMSSLEVG